MLVRKNFFYLATLSFIFLLLAISYERSDSELKRLEQDIVASATKTGVYKGDIAENFQLLNTNGDKVLLSDYRGKKVVLNFFATWCAPCQEEMPLLVEIDKMVKKEKLILIGMNVTKEEPSPNQVKKFLEHFKVQYDVLYDGEGKVMKEYQLVGIPTTILIDESGRIVERINGMLTMEMAKNHSFFTGTFE